MVTGTVTLRTMARGAAALREAQVGSEHRVAQTLQVVQVGLVHQGAQVACLPRPSTWMSGGRRASVTEREPVIATYPVAR